ncbi:MAG: polynucleotide kinase [Patescibacteria group bacterium]|nr:polynucleotide kinase [Patescibacteria group bacterium]
MNLSSHISMVEAGGPGSGCNPAAGKCGRPTGAHENPALRDRDDLNAGQLPRLDPNKPLVLVDVDGTLADSRGVRDIYDETQVLNDKPYPKIIKQVRALSRKANIVIVSGRHDTAGVDTAKWLKKYGVPYRALLMRGATDNRPDTEVKQEILDKLDRAVGKNNIMRVLDDRPAVIRMWRANGLKVTAVRGENLPEF